MRVRDIRVLGRKNRTHTSSFHVADTGGIAVADVQFLLGLRLMLDATARVIRAFTNCTCKQAHLKVYILQITTAREDRGREKRNVSCNQNRKPNGRWKQKSQEMKQKSLLKGN